MKVPGALALSLWLAGATAAADPSAGALEAFAAAMARADFGAAYDVLSQDDQRVLDRETFIRRYERISKVPWLGAVLRSARVKGGRLWALDWTYTRFAREGVLTRGQDLSTFPRRAYLEGVEQRGGRLHLGLGDEVFRPDEARAQVTGASADWFALYATILARCPPGGRYLLVELQAKGAGAEVAVECSARAQGEELVVWLDVPPKAFLGQPLGVTVVGVVPREWASDPFRAPEPDLVERPSFPTGP
jgi:hypothetical protein